MLAISWKVSVNQKVYIISLKILVNSLKNFGKFL